MLCCVCLVDGEAEEVDEGLAGRVGGEEGGGAGATRRADVDHRPQSPLLHAGQHQRHHAHHRHTVHHQHLQHTHRHTNTSSVHYTALITSGTNHNNKERFEPFLVGAFINKRARLLQSLVFFIIKDRLEATNVNVQYLQLKETKRIPRKRI